MSVETTLISHLIADMQSPHFEGGVGGEGTVERVEIMRADDDFGIQPGDEQSVVPPQTVAELNDVALDKLIDARNLRGRSRALVLRDKGKNCSTPVHDGVRSLSEI